MTKVTDSEREPGGWELLRAVQSINAKLDDFAKSFVSVELFNVSVERVKELERNLEAEKHAREKSVGELRQTAEERRKATAQTWASIGLAGVAVVFSIFESFIRQGLGLP